MKDPALQEATASEPLTLAEEYDMQRKWAEDEDKCTFILLDKSLPDTPGTGAHGGGMVGEWTACLLLAATCHCTKSGQVVPYMISFFAHNMAIL